MGLVPRNAAHRRAFEDWLRRLGLELGRRVWDWMSAGHQVWQEVARRPDPPRYSFWRQEDMLGHNGT